MEVQKEDEVDGLSTVAVNKIDMIMDTRDSLSWTDQDSPPEYVKDLNEEIDRSLTEVKGVCEHMQRHLKVVKILIGKLLQVRVDYEQGTEEDKITAHEKTDKYIAQLDYIIAELL